MNLRFLTVLALACAAAPASELTEALDQTADPCVDFHQYACGGWFKQHPMPPDRVVWGQYSDLRDRTQTILRQILEEAVRQPKNALDRQIGGYYAACIDEAAIERNGTVPLDGVLRRIKSLNRTEELPALLAELHKGGIRAAFLFSSQPAFRNSSMVVADLDQSGLGLPDRDYYLRTDSRSVSVREKYQAHVRQIFGLIGYSPEDAVVAAKAVLDFETALAKISLDRVSRRDPKNVDHTVTVEQLAEMVPLFAWQTYFKSMGSPGLKSLNVSVPEYFRGLNVQLTATPLTAWKDYLTWRYVNARADVLPAKFRDENFEFFGKTLNGAKEPPPRWKRCVALVDTHLGEALGRRYVEHHFPPATKAKVLEMVAQVESTFAKSLNELTWMTPATKKRGLEKLHTLTNKIGYPDDWRDYSDVKVMQTDAFATYESGARAETALDIRRIGKPTNPKEWHMTPPTVNAYYDPYVNSINFPAARLQPPFYHPDADAPVNFGGIAAVIGHELTHGFDDQGRKRDARGNLIDWWTTEDAKAFEERANCFVEQYGAYTILGDVRLNGKLTLGENTADNGGVRLAYRALMSYLGDAPQNKIDGLTPAQRFFIGYAHSRCEQSTEGTTRVRAQVDPHSPGKYRINGVLSNMPEFREAFGCKPGQPMARDNTCRVW